MPKIGVGLYGTNGHQLHQFLVDYDAAQLVAVAGFTREALPPAFTNSKAVRFCETLDDLITDDRVDLVSLCSPRRAGQAGEAVRCLEAGKHVYAEKPCALIEEDLDAIIAAAKRTGKSFHEMAGTAFGQPYYAMRKLVGAGTIGTVIQVLAQKSYPLGAGRPQDEEVDGGLTCQNGVHALRFIEHVAGVRVIEIDALETKLGNPRAGELRIASSMMMRLENGGVASVIANYLNPPAFGSWGNETLRIFGDKGFVEATDGGTKTRLVLNKRDCGEIDAAETRPDYFDLYVASLRGKGEMPLSLEDELHPTRMVIRARQKAQIKSFSCFNDLAPGRRGQAGGYH